MAKGYAEENNSIDKRFENLKAFNNKWCTRVLPGDRGSKKFKIDVSNFEYKKWGHRGTPGD